MKIRTLAIFRTEPRSNFECPENDRFTDTSTEAFPGDLWARASVRKMCPDFFCLTYAASVQSGHADPQSENREPDEKPGRMQRSCHRALRCGAETFQTPKPRCGTKAEAKAAERSTRVGFSGSAKTAAEIVEADVHAPFESSVQTCRPCAFSYGS